MKRAAALSGLAIAALAVLALAGGYGASLYYAAGHGSHCADCHEMEAGVSAMHASPHFNAQCTDCHDADMRTKLRHIRVHLSGNAPEQIHLREPDTRTMIAQCRSCHEQEYASWHAGPHSVTYAAVFTDAAHNAQRRLNDDCLRCHGMYFKGPVRDLVQPQNLRGPWHLLRPELADEPAIPCLACHWMHREGQPLAKPATRVSMAPPPVADSLAFYDRREELHFRAASLAIPPLHDGPRLLTMSTDPRQGVCYQCHAPRIPETGTPAALHNWGPQAGSGDDRTPMGVHEGISCIACHNGHNQSVRASCATCHPAMSNCGLNVETMDTTFANAKSAHNIHWVKCADCHQHGVPHARQRRVAGRQAE